MHSAPMTEAAYRFGQIEVDRRMWGRRRLEAIASTFAEAVGLEACGVTVREGPPGRRRACVAIHGPWSDRERRLFDEQANWPMEHRVLASRLAQMPLGRMRPRRELIDDADFRRTRLYNELQRPMGIGDQVSAMFRREDGAEMILAAAAIDGEAALPRSILERAQSLAPIAARCWVASWRAEPEWAHRLSPQCRRVLEYVDAGYDDHQIAKRLGVTYHTVRAHLKRIFRRVGVGSRLHLIQRYRGLAETPMLEAKPSSTPVVTPGASAEPIEPIGAEG